MMPILTLLVLLTLAIKDYHTQTINILFLPGIYILSFVHHIIAGVSALEMIYYIASALTIFIVFYIMARLFGFGGGDALVMPLLALQHGLVVTIYISLCACFITAMAVIIQAAIKHKRINWYQKVPFLPGVAAAYFIYIVLSNLI